MSNDAHMFEGMQGPDEAQQRALGAMLEEVDDLVKEIELLEEKLKQRRAQLNALTHGAIVDKFTAARCKEYHTLSGMVYRVENFLSGSLPKNEEKRKAALSWLTNNEASDLIKTELTVSLGRKEHNMVGEVKAALERVGVDYGEAQDVNHNTLKAFARERMKNGLEVPFEKLGLSVGRYVKIEKQETLK
jgi:hypothetical protein